MLGVYFSEGVCSRIGEYDGNMLFHNICFNKKITLKKYGLLYLSIYRNIDVQTFEKFMCLHVLSREPLVILCEQIIYV